MACHLFGFTGNQKETKLFRGLLSFETDPNQFAMFLADVPRTPTCLHLIPNRQAPAEPQSKLW